jgi:hypothetical protein
MSFSFGFSGDDVGDDNDTIGQNDNVSANAGAQSQFVGLPAEEHSLDDLVGPLFILWPRTLVLLPLDMFLESGQFLAFEMDQDFVELAWETEHIATYISYPNRNDVDIPP